MSRNLSRIIVLLMLTKFCLSIYTVQPASLNATLNSTVSFTCEATKSTVFLIYFYVGVISANEDSIVERGFIQESQYTLNETLQRSLSVWAQETNNNTNISCSTVPGNIRSTIAILKIQGLLASVGDLTTTFINESSVLLSWTAPYTLDNVPITGYYIDDGSSNYTTSDTSFVISSTDPDPCILTNVSVSPINGVGRGEPAYTSFYYERVPVVTPIMSVMLLLYEAIINVSMKINKLCIGEYPNIITFYVLETDGTVVYSNSISPEINELTMVMTGHSPLILPDISTVFIINVSLSNEGGEFNDVSSFGFASVPVSNIRAVVYNCTNITISWDSLNDASYINYYRLEIYDNSNDQLVNSAMVYGTTYQFKVEHLIYKVIITGVNEIGKGMSKSSVISFQKIPRSPEAVCTILNHTNDYVHFLVDILDTMDCILEAPDYIIIRVSCKEIGIVFSRIYPAEYNATEFVFSVPQYQAECNLSIVLSNDVGRSNPLIIPLDTTFPPTTNFIQLPTILLTSTNSTTSIVITAVTVSVCTVIILLIVCFSVLVIIIIHMKRRSKTASIVSVPNPAYDDIAKFNTNISINPAYGEVKTDTRQNVIYDEIIL
ncbi:PREDICTED: uncharacterized protein LOC109583147 [Amphimedon queenslandica]|uniref:Fibronectin type-III domain-containing protein n=1 Tax=Amphimedon queenslandica TaxID=400682 RepID=A0AAN0JB03_AMPQE|nr:PREDICTED: uncharacterized protein LOC109583147 [Amphimedon queenslandica]|eukprot:XP_019853916.1 PREDICTED: uncharacterized protein LOC109583147 [Amphimedon queenslandica]